MSALNNFIILMGCGYYILGIVMFTLIYDWVGRAMTIGFIIVDIIILSASLCSDIFKEV
jgi:hypothetical protein